jgi:hypothetical protein
VDSPAWLQDSFLQLVQLEKDTMILEELRSLHHFTR